MRERIAPPTFFPVPAGTAAITCAACRAPVYVIDTPGKKEMAVDCQVLGGRAPTDRATGTGIAHWIYCSAPARELVGRSK